MKRTYEINIYRLSENNNYVFVTTFKSNTKKKCINFLNLFKDTHQGDGIKYGYSIFHD